MHIDINCDVGEGVPNEHLLMPYISSCNIACGGHFGNVNTIDKTLKLAIKNKVLIGAHPSFPDQENFGRKIISIADDKLKESIENQLALFTSRLLLVNAQLHHIKPHGALYNLIAVDEHAANLFLKSIKNYIKNAFLYVPYNSVIAKLAIQENIKIKYEVFADRNYNNNLTLVSRTAENALLTNADHVLQHVLRMYNGKVKTISGDLKNIKAATFCVHGDTENALEILEHLSIELPKKEFKLG